MFYMARNTHGEVLITEVRSADASIHSLMREQGFTLIGAWRARALMQQSAMRNEAAKHGIHVSMWEAVKEVK
jgi:hypothetical protein